MEINWGWAEGQPGRHFTSLWSSSLRRSVLRLMPSHSAALLWLPSAWRSTTVATVLIAGLVVAATLESVFAFCLGCVMFGQLMRVGVIPETVCLECADISARLAAANS